jgi:cytosine/adenosine deaminase-related metal-dependent hydrolase
VLLDRFGGLNDRTTMVHGVFLDDHDVETVARTGTGVTVCPTTEFDLGDGTVDVSRLDAARIPVSVGTDSHASIDLLAEMRQIEWNDRARYGRRGIHDTATLWRIGSESGAAALGRPTWGIVVGAPADFVEFDLDSIRTTGCLPDDLVMTASAADVVRTWIAGELVVERGVHRRRGDIAAMLARMADPM